MRTLPRNARAFVILTCLLGTAAALSALLMPKTGGGAVWELGLFLALGILAGRTKLRLMPRRAVDDIGSLTLSFALIFATLLRLGPGAAMLVGGLSTLSSCLYPKRQPFHQVAFNLGLSAFATWVAGFIFVHMNGGMSEGSLFTLFGAVMASCFSFFLINTGAVASVIAFSTKQPIFHLWCETFLWTAPSYFAAASAGTIAILILGRQIGTVLLFVTPVAVLTYLAYVLSRQRTEENQQRIQELQIHEAQLAKDLDRQYLIAETLQRSLLTPPAEDAFPGVSVYTAYEPAWKEALVGGDFFDALPLPGNKVALVVGDVTGKGLAAATHMAEVKFALRAILHECPEPALALARLNRFLAQGQPDGGGQPLVAVALAVVNTQTGEANVASAGAEHPLLLRADGTVEEIVAGGMLLGTFRESPYDAQTLCLAPGDCLLMVTDGLIEARQGLEFFGPAGLMQAARKALSGSYGKMGTAIIADAKEFAGGTLHDDACLLLVRRKVETAHVFSGSIIFSPGEYIPAGVAGD